jgi:hypothetical protein
MAAIPKLPSLLIAVTATYGSFNFKFTSCKAVTAASWFKEKVIHVP